MARETKTVQCYPDDDKINAEIKRYEAFGWGLINNQRCQEYEGQTYGIDGSTTRHYSTFNKLTFTRDKSASWYDEVAALERDYESKESECRRYKNLKPSDSSNSTSFMLGLLVIGLSIVSIFIGLIVIALSSMGSEDIGFLLYIGLVLIAVGIMGFVGRSLKKKSKKKKYEAAYDDWRNTYNPKISALESEMDELMHKAEKIVNA